MTVVTLGELLDAGVHLVTKQVDGIQNVSIHLYRAKWNSCN